MERPKLINAKQDGETPMLGMCSVCRALFPTIKGNERDRNNRLLESAFQEHVKAEHSDRPASWKTGQGE